MNSKPLDLRAVETRADVTPAPWTYAGAGAVCARRGNHIITVHGHTGMAGIDADAIGEFIASARSDIPALLAHCRALRAALAKTATYNRVMTQDIDEARAVLAQATDQQEAK